MNSGNLLAWLRRAVDLIASGLWAVVAGLLDALRDVSGTWAGLSVIALAALVFAMARLMQWRLNDLLAAAPDRTVRWRDLELWFSLPGLLWLPVHFVRKLIFKLREGLRRPRKQPAAASEAPPLAEGAQAAEPAKAPTAPLVVATLGPSFLLGGVATVVLYAAARLTEPLLGLQLGLAPGTPAWQYLMLGRRPELGAYLPLQDSPFLAGLLAVLFWLLVGWWAARLVRLVYRRSLGSNRYLDREVDTVLPSWRSRAGATFLARPAESYVNWASWLVAGAFPLLAWAWFSLASRPFRVEASEFAVAFVLWLSWATHLSLRGVERLPAEEEPAPVGTEAQAAGWPEVLAWLEERLQVAPPRELDTPREVEPLILTKIPPEIDDVLSPLVLDLVPPPKGEKRLTTLQRILLTDLSLLAYVHLEPPLDRDRLELTGAADEVLENRSGLRKRHQVVIAPESAGKTTLALLAAANHVLVHTRSVLVVARDEDAEAALHQRFWEEAIKPTTLRWNVRIRRAGTDLMNDLSQGIVPDVIVASLQRLTVDLLGNEEIFLRFLENLGLIVVDDVESFAGPVEDHAQLAFRRLSSRVCRLLGVRDLDQRGAPQFLVLGTDSMDDLPAWARSLCGIDAVTRDFTRSRAESEQRESAEQAARGIPVRPAQSKEKDAQQVLEGLRKGRHQVSYRLRDFRTATGEPLTANALIAACEQLAVPWHYRACGDGRRRLGRTPLLLRDEPKHCVEAPEDACVVFLEGAWSDVRRERRRLRRAGARFSRWRSRNGGSAEESASGPEPIALITLVDPDEEMAFTQLDQRFGLKEVLDRLPHPILRTPSGRVRQAHLATDLVQHWQEVEQVLAVFGPGTAHTLSRLSRAGVLLTDPRIDVAPDAPRYERRLQVRALARATPLPDAPPAEAAGAPLPSQVAAVEVTAPTVVAVRDRIRSLVLFQVDAAAAGFLYYPGHIFHDARGSYTVVGRTEPETGREAAGSQAGGVEVEPLLADDLSSPRRRIRFRKPAPGPLAAGSAELDPEGPVEPGAGPDPLFIGAFPIVVALLPVELESEHIATYRLGPLLYEVRQRQIFDAEQRAQSHAPALSSWSLALFPNPEVPGGGGPALAFDPARLIAAALRTVLPSMFRGASGGLEVALRVEEERPAPERALAPWEGFFIFDVEQGGNGMARALHRDKVEELLRLCRLLIERVLDPGRLLALYDHWGDEEEILAGAGSSGPGEGGGARWQAARRQALIWLDSRLRPEGRAEGFETAAGIFAGGSQPGEGDLIDIGRCWYSHERLVSDLVWAKHRWRLPGSGEAMLDVGFDRETTTAARLFTEEARTQAHYRTLYEILLANPELRLPDGTVWGAPREAWTLDEEGRKPRSCRDGLSAEPLKEYAVLVWGMAAHGFRALAPLAEMLRERSGAVPDSEEGRLALLSYLARFVQGIPYSVPGALRAGLRPPVSTLLYRLGDCDSKSLLLALLAWHCGIPSGLFVSFQDGHALAAVSAPDPLAPEEPEPAASQEEMETPEPSPAGEPEHPSLARLAAWSERAGLPEPPCLWGELPAGPKETVVHLYVPVEATAYAPVGRARVASPATWIFLPLVSLDPELSGGGSRTLLPSDRAEHEDR